MKEFTIDLVVRHYWNDPRLSFNVTDTGVNKLILGQEFVKKIWIPDTFFVNGKDMKLHTTSTYEPTTLLRITSTGDILYSTRLEIYDPI